MGESQWLQYERVCNHDAYKTYILNFAANNKFLLINLTKSKFEEQQTKMQQQQLCSQKKNYLLI